MNQEIRNCQNCTQKFIIEPEDFVFYEKIKVPSPTWCPGCREKRRMIWRNVRTLYKTRCMAPSHKEDLISIFSPDSPITVYDQKYWWSDAWDPSSYGRKYDFEKPFFEQYKELFRAVPHPNLNNKNPVNTEYSNMTIDSRNCYLIFSGTQNENCMYAEGMFRSKYCVDTTYMQECELCYESINCQKCYHVAFAYDCIECLDSQFIIDCRNCQNCFGCWNLRNKRYYVFNQPYSREEYLAKIKTFSSDTYRGLTELKQQFFTNALRGIRRYANITMSRNVTGDRVDHSKNCTQCFEVSRLEDSKYVSKVYEGGSANYDITVGVKPELSYECAGGGSGYHNMFSSAIDVNQNITYSHFCFGSSNLFGCVGLRDKHYCILNRQYSKEEYETLLPKIIRHMNDMPYRDKRGIEYRYGEFFPPEISVFAYNESMVQEYHSFEKEQALAASYAWREEKEHSKPNISGEELADDIADVSYAVLEEAIACAHGGKCSEQCTVAFRIIPQELSFLRKMALPLPRLCPNCRHYRRAKQRNPLKLWHRKCTCAGQTSENGVYQNTISHFHGAGHCPNEFATSYADDGPEIVYCEQCYNTEVV